MSPEEVEEAAEYNGHPATRRTCEFPKYRFIIGIFILSIVLRLLALLISSPDAAGWYWDTYHRWQIAIYTLYLGLPRGRMWDLLGLEYFWGPLPILVESFLLWLFRTSSAVPFRLVNTIVGSVNVVLLYMLSKKYLLPYPSLAGILIATCPVLIFVDISGMAEPIAFLFLFGSLFFYETRPFLFGICLAFASMSRIELWPISWGLIACYLIFRRSGTMMVPALFGWLIPMVPYLWHLKNQTGDPLYPLRTNVLGDIVGQWIGAGSAPPLVAVWRAIFIGVFALSVLGLVYLIRRKPNNYLIYAFILGNLAMHGVSFGFSAYSNGFIPEYFIDRLIVLEYIFIAFAGVPLAVKYASRISHRTRGIVIRRILTALILIGVILLYSSVAFWTVNDYVTANGYVSRLFVVGDRIVTNYKGGTIISDSVIITYRMINLGIAPQSILSSIYAPRDNLVDTYRWLLKENVTIVIFGGPGSRLAELLPRLSDNLDHPPFYVLFNDSSASTVVYRVDQSQLKSAVGS